jgi:sigma-B regulation protein RsbU (phosphoserine phosphatase)
VRELTRGGLVLGVDKDATYETGITALQDGDCLLFYTDGLTDAADFQGRFWGFENMLDVAKKYTADSAQRMIEEIFRFRRRFVGLASQTDDTSIVVVKVDRRAEPDFMKRVE